MNNSNLKIILIYGNGDSTMQDHWLPYVKAELEKEGLSVVAEEFPDLPLARAEYWLPFLESLGADEQSILIGHSTGAVAAMRYAEDHKILGSVLVSACYTHLNDENEKKSGYFDKTWDWDKIRYNQQWIIQFASSDDPYVPIEEARFVHNKLETEYYEHTDYGHMGSDVNKTEFPELVKAIKDKLITK